MLHYSMNGRFHQAAFPSARARGLSSEPVGHGKRGLFRLAGQIVSRITEMMKNLLSHHWFLCYNSAALIVNVCLRLRPGSMSVPARVGHVPGSDDPIKEESVDIHSVVEAAHGELDRK